MLGNEKDGGVRSFDTRAGQHYAGVRRMNVTNKKAMGLTRSTHV